MATTININEDIERLLEPLKREYPALDYSELFNLALSELYARREQERQKIWAERLPTLELSREEAQELAEARQEIGEKMSFADLKKNLKAALSD